MIIIIIWLNFLYVQQLVVENGITILAALIDMRKNNEQIKKNHLFLVNFSTFFI